MMSTIVNRTMQSGYSELMGMFKSQQKRSVQLTPVQVKAVSPGGVASPPFKVRDQRKINEELGNYALPEGFIQLPIYNHNENAMSDDLDIPGCQYVQDVDIYRFPAESTYSQVEFLKDDLREPITKAFNLTIEESINMSFMTLYGKCDIVQSEEFEGLGTGYDYTDEQMKQINQTVLSTLVLPLSDPVLSRNMYVSKLLRLPLTMMGRFTDAIVHGNVKQPKVKFLSYSTHDWTVA